MVDFDRPIRAVHIDDGRVQRATVYGPSENPSGLWDVSLDETVDRSRRVHLFRASGFPASDNLRWRIENVPGAAVNWGQPLRAVNGDGGGARSATYQGPSKDGEGRHLVQVEITAGDCWTWTFEADGSAFHAGVGWRVENVPSAAADLSARVQASSPAQKMPADREHLLAIAIQLAQGGDPSLLDKFVAEIKAANAKPPELVDWSRPVEVVVDRPGMPPAPADVVIVNDDGSALVCFGAGAPGQRAHSVVFEAEGAPTPIRARNVAPAFDPSRPFRTASGRPAKLVARLDPPIGDKALLARVCLEGYEGETLGVYRADGHPAHGHGGSEDALVNCGWQGMRTRDGTAVRGLRIAGVGGRAGDGFLRPVTGYAGIVTVDAVDRPLTWRRDGTLALNVAGATDPLDLERPPAAEDLAPAGGPRPAAWMPLLPTRARSGAAVRKLERCGDGYRGEVDTGDGGWTFATWTAAGSVYSDGRPSPSDLVNFAPEGRPREAGERA